MTVDAWDARWCAWYELVVRQGRTPNQAVPIAWRLTEEQHGPRPGVGENQTDKETR